MVQTAGLAAHVTANGQLTGPAVLGGLAVGSGLGVVFVHWLAFQSLYRIGALCPWCMVVWSVVVPVAAWALLILVFVLALVRFWSCWRTVL